MDLDTKAALRKRLRTQRDALTPDDRARHSDAIQHHLLALPWFLSTSTPGGESVERVALYATLGSEPATEGVFAALRWRGVRLCFPRVQRDKSLRFIDVEDLAQLALGTYGIREPQGEEVSVDRVDVVIMPGLGFDRQGARLGYGVGYYDRALAHYNGICVGLAFARQLVERLPVQRHDRGMDVIVTEQEVIATSERARLVLARNTLGSSFRSQP